MSLRRTVARGRSRIKTVTPPAAVISMADVDALGSIALDLEAAGLFLDLTHYVDGEQRENHVAILLEATTLALRRDRSGFEDTRRALIARLSGRGRR